MADRVRLFISSTFKEHAYDREFIHLLADAMDLQCQMFPEQSPPGSTNVWMEALRGSHIMILLVPTERSRIVQHEIDAARELGIPIVPFYRVRPGGRTDYEAVQERARRFGLENSREHACVYSTFKKLSDDFRRALSYLLAQRMESRYELKEWSNAVYEDAAGYIPLLAHRAGIAQATSSLILGPHRERAVHERAFYDACMRGIEQALRTSGNGMRWLHVFSRDETLGALKADKSLTRRDYPTAKRAIERMERLAERIEKSRRVNIIPVAGSVPPAIVADSRFQVATVFGPRRFYMWLTGPDAGAERLWAILESLDKSENLGEFLTAAREEIAY